MECKFFERCGGCCFRHLDDKQYRELKISKIKNILDAGFVTSDYVLEESVFIGDATRRRASFTFEYKNSKLLFGFNEKRSNNIVDFDYCPLLTEKINNNLLNIRKFLSKLCQIKVLKKGKGKKFSESQIYKGDLLVLEAQNGLDIVLETVSELELEHRMEIFDFVNSSENIIRFSIRKNAFSEAETIIERLKPVIRIGGYDVYVAAGTFLQASIQGEEVLVKLVEKYLGCLKGRIADLFCGIGTFSYPLARSGENKIVAVDVNKSLLDGFRLSANKQMLHNIEILERNLFKYPLEAEELSNFDAIIFDPPRAGAEAIVKELAKADKNKKLKKVIAVSCNPHSFVKDANVLIKAGYKLESVTMVDQFVYSNHMELVALFTTN